MENLIACLAKKLLEKNLKLVTAESCTGGGIAYFLTEIPGSSKWFERGFVTYSNEAKQELLNVPQETIKKFGAVSEETAVAMAKGALENSHAQIAIAVTGVAGPGGGTKEKPVGTVWIAWVMQEKVFTEKHIFTGDRQQIRLATIQTALSQIVDMLKPC